jgi:exosortase E/protease (VPEID-CTERM system)
VTANPSPAIPVASSAARFGLRPRLLLAGVLLTLDILAMSSLIQDRALDELTGAARTLHALQHWLFRFLIAYAGSLAILLALRASRAPGRQLFEIAAPFRLRYLLLHAVLLPPFALLSRALYRSAGGAFFWIAVGWHVCAVALAAALAAAIAPRRTWDSLVAAVGRAPWVAVLPALGAMLVYRWSQMFWVPAATLTFRIVGGLVRLIQPQLYADPDTLTLHTKHFAVVVTEECSGLEGVGLMLVFCGGWLWYFRRHFRFPRALLIVPLAALLIFALNALRITALVLLGEAGLRRMALVGFHSQAGWIAFNAAAFGLALLSRRSAWFNRTGAATVTAEPAAAINLTAAYLMPLLLILASGMLTHAMSAGFDAGYALRLVSGGLALWWYRECYRGLDWHFSWRGIAVGGGIFALWWGYAALLQPAHMPDVLALLPAAGRIAWLATRVATAVLIVPVAEELAFRAFLLRRLTREDFASLPFTQVRAGALLVSAVAFGIVHGRFWVPGILAGLALGVLAMRSNRLGEAVAAHATANALLGVVVLATGDWRLW